MKGERFFTPFFDGVEAPAALRSFILTELGSSARHWHGLLHHALMLRQVNAMGEAQRQLVLAILFHDIVYDARRTDNEDASAEVARRWLSADDADAVAPLILATKTHHLASADAVTRTLLQADLAVLWTPSAALYRFYASGIRAEYAHVPDVEYRAGRAAVLSRLQDTLTSQLDAERRASLAHNLDWERLQLQAGSFDLQR